jgi:hypothetical protein
LADKYIAKLVVWPHSTTPQVQCGPSDQFVTIPAQTMRQANHIADLLVDAIRTNPYVWTCKVTEIREAGHNESPRLEPGDSEAVYAYQREVIAKVERDARQAATSQAEKAAMRREDQLKLDIERLTFAVRMLMPDSAHTEESLRMAWESHRRLQMEQFEAV